jgi:hypothetical protein
MRVLLDLYPEGKKKALTLSYDDGHTFDRRLVEILNQYGLKATFHLNSNKLGNQRCIRAEEVNPLYVGHEVATHTLTHPRLESLSKEEVIEEIIGDRKNLESITNSIVTGFSYPYGSYSDEVVQVLPSLGIEYARTIQATNNFDLPQSFYLWHPTCHHRDNSVELGQKYLTFNPEGRLTVFYMWGHSHNFDSENNWDIIEEFAKKMSGQQDIWYATNIELVKYIKAVRSLQFSTVRDRVYNPTDIRVWFHVDGNVESVGPGERKVLTNVEKA